MSLLGNVAIFAIGFFLGAGSMLLYFQYSMYHQVGQVEDQMQQLMEMDEMMQDIEESSQDKDVTNQEKEE